jgi:hypothetical protein
MWKQVQEQELEIEVEIEIEEQVTQQALLSGGH